MNFLSDTNHPTGQPKNMSEQIEQNVQQQQADHQAPEQDNQVADPQVHQAPTWWIFNWKTGVFYQLINPKQNLGLEGLHNKPNMNDQITGN